MLINAIVRVGSLWQPTANKKLMTSSGDGQTLL